ncbi:MAG: hypothetical protein H7A37_04290 [Chlamydiales bacterium]|nr:hypothetical protein [Chlamydiia bacterium]MCP5507506.1 hypothetical protein [Chlamydiales bacterium]
MSQESKLANAIVLRNKTEDGVPLEATFLPEKGMSLISYKKGDIEVLDQSTAAEFQKTNAGLGVLIGPHFHKRNPEIIPPVPDESLYPHIAAMRAEGGAFDPFTHGIGRYAPWTYISTESTIRATLKGTDMWNGHMLQDLEGQNFTMDADVSLTSTGLELTLSVVGQYDSIIGIHYYYHLPRGTGTVSSRVANKYIFEGKNHPIPEEWGFDSETQMMHYKLDKDTDFTFHAFPDPLRGEIILDAGDYKLRTTYDDDAEENSWQLWHPKGASFVCIEPNSSWNPRRVNLTVSEIHIKLEII